MRQQSKPTVGCAHCPQLLHVTHTRRRSLGQFQGLLEYKAGALPVPDVLITAVGTKIWRLDVQVWLGAEPGDA